MRGELRGLPETLAEIFYPLLGLLPRQAYLRLFDALFAVGAVPEFPELRAGLGVQNGLHRFFDGLTTPVRPDLRFSANFACTEFLDPLCARTCYNCIYYRVNLSRSRRAAPCISSSLGLATFQSHMICTEVR